jgi:hypothetical protein
VGALVGLDVLEAALRVMDGVELRAGAAAVGGVSRLACLPCVPSSDSLAWRRDDPAPVALLEELALDRFLPDPVEEVLAVAPDVELQVDVEG